MELKDIVSVSGVAGLHKVIGRNKAGLIVETIGTGKKFATTANQRVSVLSDIAIFTEEGEARLWQVLKNIQEAEKAGKTVPDTKADNNAVKAYMAVVLPDYDKEKVYTSDMKKLFSWYGIIKDILNWESLGKEEETDNSEASDSGSTDKPIEKAPKSVAPKKVKTAAPRTAGGAKTKTTTPRKMGS